MIAFNVASILLYGWFLLEFLSKGDFRVPTILSDLYVVVLGFYAGDKEIHRWHHQHQSAYRRGEFFVLGWVATLVLALLIEIIGGAEHGYVVPAKLGFVAGSVVIIFFITEYLKTEYHRKVKE